MNRTRTRCCFSTQVHKETLHSSSPKITDHQKDYFLTDKIVGWKGVCIPNLQVKSGGNLLLWLVPREETGLQEEEANGTVHHCETVLIFNQSIQLSNWEPCTRFRLVIDSVLWQPMIGSYIHLGSIFVTIELKPTQWINASKKIFLSESHSASYRFQASFHLLN